MKIDLNKIQNPKYFYLIWCLLGVCIFWQIGTTMARSVFLPRHVRKALEHYKASTKKNMQIQASMIESKHEQKSMFAPPKKVQMPTCVAVLGNEALINDKWYKVGSTAGGAEIVAINPESVTILWEGKEHILVPFDVKVEFAGQARKDPSPSATKEASVAPRPDGRSIRNTENTATEKSSDKAQQMRERYQESYQRKYRDKWEEQRRKRQLMRPSRGRE